MTNADTKYLLSLCRAGKLYEIERWIKDGKSIHVPADVDENPIQVSLELGFHSLVELLLRHERSQEEKNAALARAVRLRRLDLVELALDYGAELRSVPLANVLVEWNPNVIRLFLDRGADIIKGAPFAEAFREKIRTALGPFLDCKRKYPELVPQLEEQADRALRYFASQKDEKWVSLMLWLGADPRSRGPNMNHWCDEDDPESHTTALEEVCQEGNLKLLKRMAPDRAKDDLEALLEKATWRSSKEVITYLLDLGANPNNAENGGSTALSHALWRIHLDSFDPNRVFWNISKYTVAKPLSVIDELASRGAHWVPRDNYEMTSVRRMLFKCDPDVTIEILKVFTKYRACSEEVLRDFIGTASMKKHLRNCESELIRLGLKKAPLRPGTVTVKSSCRKSKARAQVVPAGLLRKYSREKLYTEVWVEPLQKVSKKYGVSDVAIAKACRKLGVPLPGRGYWAKKVAGKVWRRGRHFQSFSQLNARDQSRAKFPSIIQVPVCLLRVLRLFAGDVVKAPHSAGGSPRKRGSHGRFSDSFGLGGHRRRLGDRSRRSTSPRQVELGVWHERKLPRRWTVTTEDGLSLGMMDVRRYFKAEDIPPGTKPGDTYRR